MTSNKEIEVKRLISKNDFEILRSHYSDFCVKNIRNIYLDTDDFKIRKSDGALRLRITSKYNHLTLKLPAEDGLIEHTINLNNVEVSEFLETFIIKDKDMNDVLKNLDVYSINKIAELETMRIELAYADSLIAIDHTFYNGLEDYEIECESNTLKRGNFLIDKFLSEFNIVGVPNKIPKIERAIRTKQF